MLKPETLVAVMKAHVNTKVRSQHKTELKLYAHEINQAGFECTEEGIRDFISASWPHFVEVELNCTNAILEPSL